MIIIGGVNSSNTKKLYEIAKANCKKCICVETAVQLDIAEIEKVIKLVLWQELLRQKKVYKKF